MSTLSQPVAIESVCLPVAHADEEIYFIPDVDVGRCFGEVEEQITGPVHATNEPEGLLEGAHSPLLPLTANLRPATIGIAFDKRVTSGCIYTANPKQTRQTFRNSYRISPPSCYFSHMLDKSLEYSPLVLVAMTLVVISTGAGTATIPST